MKGRGAVVKGAGSGGQEDGERWLMGRGSGEKNWEKNAGIRGPLSSPSNMIVAHSVALGLLTKCLLTSFHCFTYLNIKIRGLNSFSGCLV